LKRTFGNCFEGQITGRSAGTASALLYSNEVDYLLFGKWIENEWEQIWWVTLKQVDRFPDEMRREATNHTGKKREKKTRRSSL
jgi:hypothetical protein